MEHVFDLDGTVYTQDEDRQGWTGQTDCIRRQAAIEYFVSLWDCMGEIADKDEWRDVCETTANEIPSAQPEIIHCNSCKYWTQSTGKMKGYGLGRCDFHDADLVTCNGFCYWAERRNDG